MFDLLLAIAAQVWEMFGPAFDHGWPRLAVVELCFAPCAKFPTMFDPCAWPVLGGYARPGKPGSASSMHLSSMFLPVLPSCCSAAVCVCALSRRPVSTLWAPVLPYCIRGRWFPHSCFWRHVPVVSHLMQSSKKSNTLFQARHYQWTRRTLRLSTMLDPGACLRPTTAIHRRFKDSWKVPGSATDRQRSAGHTQQNLPPRGRT